mmetsp:Transcript_41209/g.92957  ORF Transcript_41209/g.92957 Transcript_41209/m.92957 type:complete len:304 (+) Transcript_41209:108-1019(+)
MRTLSRSQAAAEAKEDVPQRNGPKDVAKKVVCALGVVLVLVVLLAGLIAVRHARRGAELEPLVNFLKSSQACTRSPERACTIMANNEVSDRFDLHEPEALLLGFLFDQALRGNLDETAEVLSGAHMVLEDADGSAYGFLTTLPGAHRRISSHASTREQYGIPEGRVLSSLLVGTIQNMTWLQLEGSPWNPWHDPWRSLGHILDFLEYVILQRNVGPLGTSRATDKMPILMGRVLPVEKACPAVCGGSSIPQREVRPHDAIETAKAILVDLAGAASAPSLRGSNSTRAGIRVSRRQSQAITLDD